MCLHVSYGRKSGKRTGYKILTVMVDGIFTGMCGASSVELNDTEFTKDPRERTRVIQYGVLGSGEYTPGFHIFAKLSHARKVLQHESGVIFKVAFRREVAFGQTKWHWYLPTGTATTDTIVARECKILKRITQ